MKKWKIKSEREILSADLFEVYAQNLIDPLGREKKYKIVRRRPVVSVIPLTDKNQIYLVGQDRPLLRKYSWALMAGFMEKGEKPLQAAKRELKEETGLIATQWQRLGEIEMAASVVKSISYLYLARGLKLGRSQPDDDEHITLKKVDLSQAVKDVLEGKINTAISMAGILMVDKLIQERKL